MKKKKYNKKYYTGGRVDMSKGGRVGFQKGGPKRPGEQEPPAVNVGQPVPEPVMGKPEPQPAPQPQPQPQPAPTEDVQPGRPQWWRRAGLNFNSLAEARAAGYIFDPTTGEGIYIGNTDIDDDEDETDDETDDEPTAEELAAQEKARQQQVARQSAEAAARGEVPEAAQLPDAVQVGFERDAQGQLILDDQGNPIPLKEQQTTTMAAPTAAQTFQARPTAKEAVATSQAAQADTTIGQDIKAGRYDAATVADKDVDVQAAREREARPIEDVAPGVITGDVTFATVDELQAEAAQAQRVDDILGPDNDYLVKEVSGKDTTVAATPDAERSERETILGQPAPDSVAAAINDTVGYTAAKQRQVIGKAAQSAAADMIAQTAD